MAHALSQQIRPAPGGGVPAAPRRAVPLARLRVSAPPRRRAGPAPAAALPSMKEAAEVLREAGRRAAAAAGAAVVAASLLAAPPPALSDEAPPGVNIIRLPASENPAILVAQQTLVQAWQIVGESFFDPKFGGSNWTDELRAHMMAAYRSADGPSAYHEIGAMLADLKDPYTRLLPPDEYRDFVVSANGELQGVGLLIANEPVEGHLLVLAPIKGSPADRAGVKPGDILTSINGEDTGGWTGEQAAAHLRGQGGTQVRVRLVRHTDAIPGVPGRPPPSSAPPPRDEEITVSLTRERVELSPVSYAALPAPNGGRLGYVRLSTFSQNAGRAVRSAVRDLQRGGDVDGWVLDLRSNPGGLVQSAADVARVFLDGAPTLFTVSGRSTEQLQEVTLEEGAPDTTAPLAVLVNHGSASASEILSGALHDNHRAVVIGDERTYGKGRIQSVYELDDGSALFVTVARYRTPAGSEIDLRGIRPDVACGALAPRGRGGQAAAPAAAWPGGLGGGDDVAEALPELDSCLLTAMNALARPASKGGPSVGPVLAAAQR
ncbi:carboxyl-terminal-processing peptidase chloroplastic [Raphidocelis subcapitata]|uniref:Carboxyl-terminal-processing peptidase chloroplastic n=1 Tax=Raphidocelis subcapitata TaxID=307507 RepID=A0A2V0PEJ7_9CHLO|nr:carboxyl-terminal-processing peptidase chloroplastic [Raphidocelis subcapitata]|eukprot:GBF96323.1 carboxyl-terminal-processing peptidase chloroplastic [Raphidocelis subcapitata]